MTGRARFAERFRTDFAAASLAACPADARGWYERLERVAEDEIAPTAAENDRHGTFPAEALAALKRLGATAITIPTAYGGLGWPDALAALTVETLARACPSTAAILMFHYQVVRRTLEFGHEPWRAADLRDFAAGRHLGSSAWTEIGAGADKSGTRTRITAQGPQAQITGEKHFCTGLESSGILHVLVDSSDIVPRTTSFVRVPVDARGVDLPEIYPLLGLRASSTGSIGLTDARVETGWLIGEAGDGPALMRHNHLFLMNPGLIALGIARDAIEAAKASVTGVERGSRDASGSQPLRVAIATMENELAAAYALAADCIAAQSSAPAERHARNLRLKLVASRCAVEIASRTMLIAGGRGFHAGWPHERHLRDAYATVVMGPPDSVIQEALAAAALAPAEPETHSLPLDPASRAVETV